MLWWTAKDAKRLQTGRIPNPFSGYLVVDRTDSNTSSWEPPLGELSLVRMTFSFMGRYCVRP